MWTFYVSQALMAYFNTSCQPVWIRNSTITMLWQQLLLSERCQNCISACYPLVYYPCSHPSLLLNPFSYNISYQSAIHERGALWYHPANGSLLNCWWYRDPQACPLETFMESRTLVGTGVSITKSQVSPFPPPFLSVSLTGQPCPNNCQHGHFGVSSLCEFEFLCLSFNALISLFQ